MQTVMLISNPRAGSVSGRTRDVIERALMADFKLEVAETERRDHAQELSKDAADRGFDAVLAFGGDGTINEVAQGVVGSSSALGILPGGTTNVMARALGMPKDPVEATSFVASHIRSGTRRRINVGRIHDRYFLFSCGIGLDAEVVKRVEADPKRYQGNREWTFVKHGLAAGSTEYRSHDPKVLVTVGDAEPFEALFAICCNARPFTYFKRFPVDVCPEALLDKGLDLLTMRSIHALTIPRVIWSIFVSRSHTRWKNSTYLHDLPGFSWSSERPLPVQVDGDYIGEWTRGDVVLERDALDLLV
jgi:diacylglycerol kinase family enzyme